MRVIRLLLTALIATAPGAALSETVGWDMVHELNAIGEPCKHLGRPSIHNPEIISLPDRRARGMLNWLLRLDPAACPGLPEAAWQRLEQIIGDPERGDVPVDYLQIAWRAARDGLGRPRDPALAERLARIAWLFDYENPRDMEEWGEDAPRRWIAHPDTPALLEARMARNSALHYRQFRLLGETRLLRDRPTYDPRQAFALLEQGRDYLRQADLLSSGEHLPPDYRRAGALVIEAYLGTGRAQRAMLDIGRRANAAARNQGQRAEALRYLFAGSIDGIDDSCALIRRQLDRLGSVPTVQLGAGDAERIAAAMNFHLQAGYGEDVANPVPIRMRGLIDPEGRLLYAELLNSSGSESRDFSARTGWAWHAEKVNLAATSRGRLVWVELPPVVADSPLQSFTPPAPRTFCQ